MIPFARILKYGNTAAAPKFKGILTQITPGTGYSPVGRNNTSSASVNTIDYPRVYFYGGLNAAGGYLTDVFYYDIQNNRYVLTSGSGLGALRSAGMAYNDDGYVYVFGGANSSNVGQNQFFRIRVSNNTTEVITGDTGRPTGTFGQTVLSIQNFLFFFSGGSSAARQVITRYNVSTKVWTVVRTGVTTPDLIGGQPSIVYNNKVYIAASDGLYEFNTTTFTLTKMANQPPGYGSASYSMIVEGEWYFMNNYSSNLVSRYNTDGTWTTVNNTNLGSEIFTAWVGYNSNMNTAYLLFGGAANERSTRIRKLS